MSSVFLPALAAAWFVAEPARNLSALLSGLMLLDLMEAGIALVDGHGNNLYSWRYVLVHPEKPEDSRQTVMIRDLYGDEVDLARFDGVHPMAHGKSVDDSRSNLQKGKKLTAVRQKEGHLLIHWLSEKIKTLPQPFVVNGSTVEHEIISAYSLSPLSGMPPQSLQSSPSYEEIELLYNAQRQPSRKIKSSVLLLRKWEILHKVILPLLIERQSALECLLPSQVSPLSIASLSSSIPYLAATDDKISTQAFTRSSSSSMAPDIGFTHGETDGDNDEAVSQVAWHSQRSISQAQVDGMMYSSITVEVKNNGNCGFTATAYALYIADRGDIAASVTRAGFIGLVGEKLDMLRGISDPTDPTYQKLATLIGAIYDLEHMDFDLTPEKFTLWATAFNKVTKWAHDAHFALLSYTHRLRFEFYVVDHGHNDRFVPRGGGLGEGSIINAAEDNTIITIRLLHNSADLVNPQAVDPNNHFDLLYFDIDGALKTKIKALGYVIIQDSITSEDKPSSVFSFTSPLTPSLHRPSSSNSSVVDDLLSLSDSGDASSSQQPPIK